MTTFSLDSSLLESLVKSRFQGDVAQILDAWAQCASGLPKAEAIVPDRSTIYRWIDGGVPRTADRLLRFCGILNVDPFAVMQFPEGYASSAAQILTSHITGVWRPAAMHFLTEFVGHKTIWPPTAIARQYYQRDWRCLDFIHSGEGRVNFFGAFLITPQSSVDPEMPQVFHFGFRQPNLFAERWLEYGYVQCRHTQVRLMHMNGDAQVYERSSLDEPIHVETHFGSRPVEFRVASLHGFETELDETPQETDQRVRFEG